MQRPPPHPLLDLALTVLAPSAALEWLSPAARLGPFWALVVASLLPLGWGLYCWITKQGLNFFSIIGLIAVVVTGGLGLLNLSAFWFGIKEISVPVLIGLAFPLSHQWGPQPLVVAMLMQAHLINEQAVRASLDTPAKQSGFERLLWLASLGLGFGMLFSAVLNFALAMYLLGGKEPGSEAYVQAIGTLNWGGTLIISIPLMVIMMAVLMRFMHGIQQLTGLERADLMNQGKTVRRHVVKPPCAPEAPQL
jgi:hypothetical protein